MDSRRRLSSHESSSPLSQSGGSGSESSYSAGTAFTDTTSSARNTLASRGTTHTSAASMADSVASEQEHAPSGEHSGSFWFNWW